MSNEALTNGNGEIQIIRATSAFDCGGRCPLRIHVKDGMIVRIEGDDTAGEDEQLRACLRCRAYRKWVHHPDRLKYPMKRTNPKGSTDPGFTRISWDEAYDMIVDHLNRIKKEHGPHSVFFYVGDPKEPRAAVQRLAATYGSVNYGCESSTACRRAALLAEFLNYGFPTMGDLPTEETKVMLIWGTNPAYSGQPFMCHGHLADAKERGVKFIVVDPRISPVAGTLADIHLRPRPATTAALAAGMMHVIFEEGLEDKEFCDKWIHGINRLKN